MRRTVTLGILLVLVLCGGWLRFTHLKWDFTNPERNDSTYQHSDERNIFSAAERVNWSNVTLRQDSSINPGFFAYGTFPIYTLKAFSYVHSSLFAEGRLYGGGTLNYFGRMQSAFFGVLAIFAIYLLASRLFGRRVGLLSAFFMTFAFHHIQTSHYATVETLLTFFLLVVMYLCWRWIWDEGWKAWLDAALIGLVTGAALATKFSAMTFLAPIGIAWLARLWEQWKREPGATRDLRAICGAAVLVVILAYCGAITVYPVLKGFGYFTDVNAIRDPVRREARIELGKKLDRWLGRTTLPRLVAVPAEQWDAYRENRLPREDWIRLGLIREGQVRRDFEVIAYPTPLVRGGQSLGSAAATFRAIFMLALRYLFWFGFLNLLLPIALGLLVVLLALYPAPLSRYTRFSERWLLSPLVVLLVALLFAFALAPMQFIDQAHWKESIRYEGGVVAGPEVNDVPYTRQFVGTAPYFFQLRNLVDYGLGEPLGLLGIAGLLGFLIFAVQRWRSRREIAWAYWLLLAWAVPYFYIAGGWHTKFLRYMVPLYPFFIIGAAWLLVRAWERWPRVRPRAAVAAVALGTMIFCVLYAFALENMYASLNTRLAASNWMYDNAPKGSRILKEHWDDQVPNRTAEHNLDPHSYFQLADLQMYDEDNASKIQHLINRLTNADYVMWSSKRLYGSILRLPDRYPVTGNFYRLMFSGYLGYELVHVETDYPRILGITFNDDLIEESARCYDHPKVSVFKKVRIVAPEVMREYLVAPPPDVQAITLKDILLHQESRSIYDHSARSPVWRFFIFFELLALIGVPLVFLLAPHLPDAGWGLARPLSLLLLGYGAWILPSMHLVPFGRPLIFVLLLLLAAVSLAIAYWKWDQLALALRVRWKWILCAELVYLVLFGVFLGIRAFNPDIFWGEKPMDMSFLSTTYRSTWFPPADPWIAGKTVNYYYLGHPLLAVVGVLLNLSVEYLDNLCIGVIPALAGGAAFSIIVLATKRAWAAALGAYFLALSGSLWSAALWFYNHSAAWGRGLSNYREIVGTAPFYKVPPGTPGWPTIPPAHPGDTPLPAPNDVDWSGAISHLWALIKSGVVFFTGAPIREGGFDNSFYWRSGHDLLTGTAANEFPAWTFLFADLHAHMIVMPFTLLFIGLAAALLFSPGGREGAPRRGALLVLLSFVLGALACINTWDLPTSAILLVAVLFWRYWAYERHAQPGAGHVAADVATGLLHTGFAAALVVAGAFAFFTPFHTNFDSRVEVGMGAVARSWGSNTPPAMFLLIFGGMLFFVAWYLLSRLWRPDPDAPETREAWRARLWRLGAVAGLLLVGLLAAHHYLDPAVRAQLRLAHDLPHEATLDYRLMALLVPFVLWAFWHALRTKKPGEAAAAILAGVGLGLAAGVEFFYIRETWGFPAHRWNTAFKFYLHVWIYLSLAGGIGAGFMFARRPSRDGQTRAGQLGRVLVIAVALFLVLPLTLIFPIVGAYTVTKHPSSHTKAGAVPTLDGLSWFQRSDPESWRAYQWIEGNIKGQPIMLEAPGESYHHETSRVSSMTGLPTLLAWPHHVKERSHPEDLVRRREQNATAIYTSNDKRRVLGLLSENGVDYIYAGKEERRRFGNVARHFSGYGDVLDVVYHNDDVMIYKVRRNMNSEYMGEVVEMAPADMPGQVGENMIKGGQGFGFGQFREPRGVFAGADNRVYVADTFNHRIQVFDARGEFLYAFGSEGDGEIEFKEPNDVLLDFENRIIVLDTWNNRLQVFDNKGRFQTIWAGDVGLYAPRAITCDPENQRYYLADTGNGRVRVLNATGELIASYGERGEGPGRLNNPMGIAYHDGRVYVLDRNNNRVVVLDASARYLSEFPLQLSGSQQVEPKIAATPDGRLLVSDVEGYRILILNRAGEMLGAIGTPQMFSGPAGIGVSPSGSVAYVADVRAHRVAMVRLPPP